MLNDSIQNEKKKPDFFSSDLLIKIDETAHDKIIAIKNSTLNLLFQNWNIEIMITKNKLIKEIIFDFRIPKIIGMVFNFTLSYLISLMSKRIVIANTKRKRANRWKMIFGFIAILFSEINKSMLLMVQVRVIINILQNGIFLSPRGYKMDIIPEIKMRIWVFVLNWKKWYKLPRVPITIRK